MGRSKIELKRIHRKKIKKAKQKIKLYKKGEIPYSSLTQKSRHFLEKSKKKKLAVS